MASGDTLSAFTPLSNDPPSADAAIVARLIPTGNRTRTVLRFPASADREAVFTGKLLSYGGGGVTVRTIGAMDGANTGTKVVRFEAAFERLSSGEAQTASGFASAIAAESTVDNDSRERFTASINLSNSQIDGVGDGDWFRLRIKRLNSGLTGENASGAMDVEAVDIVEQ